MLVPPQGEGDDGAALVGGASRFAEVNGVRLHYVEAGAGPLVVLLHGFPNFWWLWRRHIPLLAAAGFRVVAPDLRGYNLSAKPSGAASYAVSAIARDVAELVRACDAPRAAGAPRATVVGHDWGGVVAWRLGASHADVVRGLVVINAPHPAAFARELRSPGQLARSWYAAFFQLPVLPELALSTGRFAAVARVLRRGPARADAFTEDDVERHRRALARPGALHAALGYYRAAFRRAARDLRSAGAPPVTVPTLLLWGDRDAYLRPGNARGLERWAARLRVRHFPGATHWLPVEEPAAVAEEIAATAAGPG